MLLYKKLLLMTFGTTLVWEDLIWCMNNYKSRYCFDNTWHTWCCQHIFVSSFIFLRKSKQYFKLWYLHFRSGYFSHFRLYESLILLLEEAVSPMKAAAYIKGKCKCKAIPLQAMTGTVFPEGWGSQILWQSAHEGGKVVSPTHRPPLLPESIPGTHFC